VVENVNVISMTKEGVEMGKAIVMKDGKIEQVVNMKELRYPPVHKEPTLKAHI
jgi:hypothetical protein